MTSELKQPLFEEESTDSSHDDDETSQHIAWYNRISVKVQRRLAVIFIICIFIILICVSVKYFVLRAIIKTNVS